MDKESISLQSYPDLPDKIKVLKIGNCILKGEMKTPKRPIKVLVQR